MQAGAENRNRRQARLGDEDHFQTTTISVSKALTVKEQIAEVSRVLGAWLQGLAVPFDAEREDIFLTEYRGGAGEYRFRYEICEKFPN
jgi:hypothetical protein